MRGLQGVTKFSLLLLQFTTAAATSINTLARMNWNQIDNNKPEQQQQQRRNQRRK